MNKVDVPLDGRFYGNLSCFDKTYRSMIKPGLLLVSVAGYEKPNVMTIGVSAIATLPGRPVFIVWVRPPRYTYELIEESGDFTVNVPDEGMQDIVKYCGTVSGRDFDKFADQNLTAIASREVTSPVIEECLIHYECRVVDKIDTRPDNMVESLRAHHQPGNFHRLYFGQIVATYANADLLE